MDEEFLHRLETAFLKAPSLPEQKHGRIAWLQRQIGRLDGGEPPTFESVRRWFSGRSKPRGRNMELLCKVLNVDQAWLAYGTAPSGTRREQVEASDRADGAVYYVIGRMLLDGINAGMPANDDDLASGAGIDIQAIINRKSRRFTVSTAEPSGNDGGYVARPRMPSLTNDHLIVVPGNNGFNEVFLLKAETIQDYAHVLGDYAEINILAYYEGAIDVKPVSGEDGVVFTSLDSMREL